MKSRRRRLLPRVLLGLLALGLALTLLPVLLLRFVPPLTSAYMLQSPVKPVQYQWVSAANISDSMRRAVVASEDQKFWDHHGFDVEAIEKAYEHNQRSKNKRGASTISQQTAKNLFLWAGGGYFRKGLEAGYTVLIEKLWNKQRILEVYLNIAEFGPGIYGVEAASQAYFHHSAAQLSPYEAASLAAVLPSPRHWSARSPGPYVQSRISWIMGQIGFGHRGGEEPEIPDDLQQQIDAENAGNAAASDYAPAPSLPSSETQSDAPVVERPAAEPETPAAELTPSLPPSEAPHSTPADAPAATP